MTQRVLVTGGAGFIGSHVAEQYLTRGYEVTVLDNLSSGRRENVPAGARFVQEDVRAPAARALLGSGGFTVLNHHAAQADVRVSVRDPRLDADVNLLGLLNLLEGAREGGVERVVFASSGGVVYGEGNTLPYPETAPKLPVSPYGVSKLASEYYLAQYAILHGMGVRCLRYANVYGPRQNPHGEAGVVAIFGSRLRHRRAITVYGDGAQTRDYVFVGDVARANVLASETAVALPATLDDLAVNVGTACETSVNDLARKMMRAVGIEVPIEYAPARAGELMRSAVAVDKAATALGWRPEASLDDGLRRTYEWISGVEAA
jgi:UDP-glucose 4-epimerase